jgi:hypothetical protein
VKYHGQGAMLHSGEKTIYFQTSQPQGEQEWLAGFEN